MKHWGWQRGPLVGNGLGGPDPGRRFRGALAACRAPVRSRPGVVAGWAWGAVAAGGRSGPFRQAGRVPSWSVAPAAGGYGGASGQPFCRVVAGAGAPARASAGAAVLGRDTVKAARENDVFRRFLEPASLRTDARSCDPAARCELGTTDPWPAVFMRQPRDMRDRPRSAELGRIGRICMVGADRARGAAEFGATAFSTCPPFPGRPAGTGGVRRNPGRRRHNHGRRATSTPPIPSRPTTSTLRRAAHRHRRRRTNRRRAPSGRGTGPVSPRVAPRRAADRALRPGCTSRRRGGS